MNRDDERAMNRASLLKQLKAIATLAQVQCVLLPPEAEVQLVESTPPSRTREEARRRRQIARGLLVATSLLTSGCSSFLGPGDLTMPPPEALSAAVVASYPFVARACLTLAPPVKRPLCIAGAREALGRALEVHDAAIDAQLAAPVGAGERAVTR